MTLVSVVWGAGITYRSSVWAKAGAVERVIILT